MNNNKLKKIANAVLKNTIIRIMLLLTVLFVVIGGTLILTTFAFQNRLGSVESQILDTQKQIDNLQNTINTEETKPHDEKIIQRQFAPYEEIVPFISLLENLFGLIDPKAQISIRDEERQILANRYADYQVRLKIGNKKTVLFKALDQLYQSKYLTRIMSFNMEYSTIKDKNESVLDEADFIIRLYFE